MASRAVRMDPHLPEAQFNLALALERCSLIRQARRAWQQYLRLDRTTGWAKEAREHLKALRKPSPLELWRVWERRIRAGQVVVDLPGQLYSIAREDAMEGIFGRWASKTVNEEIDKAKDELEVVRRIGTIIPVDQTLHDEVEVITRSDEKKILQLCKGHLDYRDGMRLLRSGRIDLAQPLLESSTKMFSSAGSPFQYWADLFLADIASRKSNNTLAESLLKKIRDESDLSRYSDLNNELFLIEGLMCIRRADFSASRSTFSKLSRLGPAGPYLAEIAVALGESPWSYRIAALRSLSAFPNSQHLLRLFIDLAASFSPIHQEASLRLLNEALELADEIQDRSLMTEVLALRIKIEEELNYVNAAERDALTLQRIIPTIEDPLLRERRQLEREISACQIPTRAKEHCAEILTTAISYYNKHDQKFFSETYRLRARTYHSLAKTAAEEADLFQSIRTLQSLAFLKSPEWHSALDGIFNELIVSSLTLHQDQYALTVTDFSRGAYLRKSALSKKYSAHGYPSASILIVFPQVRKLALSFFPLAAQLQSGSGGRSTSSV